MMRTWKQRFALGTCLMLGITGLAGCAGGDGNGNGNAEKQAADSGPTPISIWASLNTNVSITLKNMSEITAIKEWEKKTNIKTEFQHGEAPGALFCGPSAGGPGGVLGL